ncbi:phospholipase D-like domain-containing protein [Thermoflavimicrobium dichotomicum]|uniref:Phosphatidylserine/phosphatidylglycerophosphate/cardiolipin synthase n=1 Tax=Thermoflavimicrobium dichotomicum TaxID=46223 RepID=A0A1I3U3W4_9BACL|nr:Phosphatidylserine/phosphatidylglycerophosphate/cardiolipin synthase [Thermoflavimicrobium dichotomicum]
MVWILGLYLLNTVFMLIIAVREVRRPAKALNWLTIGLILPVIGFGLYLSTSNPVRIRRERLTSPHNESDTLPVSFSRSASVIAHALRHLTVHGLRPVRVQILTNGIETYENLIKSIQNAQRTIDLEYYIYRDDQIGRRITDLLIERAKAGVRIRFLRDGWGSRKFPQHQIIRMMNAGIECRTFFPMRFPWVLSNWNYRNHCKNVVIDGKEAFTGGINVGDEYTGLKPNVGFWHDTHLRMVGEATVDLQTVFDAHWNIASPERMKTRIRWNTKAEDTKKPIQGPRHISQNIVPPGRDVLSKWSAKWSTELGTMDGTDVSTVTSTETLQKAYVQTLEGNPGIPTQVIRQAYFICLTQATQTIDITTPYFVPDADIIMAIKTAIARGVRVRLLVPRHVSPKIVGSASRTYYGELLEAGVQIYLYNKGMLHAKLMIIDGEIAEVGAANYDMRSFRLDYEVCEVFYSADVARELTEQFERDLTDSVPLHIEDLRQRSLSQRILDQGARLLSPLL